ncbi:hypothetical protein [Cytobacillus firmus]|uniref:hypothetical protein n=1 Tax=Cytobacillus firmus TaxID=1399 RepID=UPI00064E1A88|nr:hypothetical protein [Cytobacillus firmus]KML41333.1 hypothetical protein VL14_11450 [Cytobacillus firmus]
MERRNFLVYFLLWILAFFFGYSIKKEDGNMTLYKTDGMNASHKIENINEQLAGVFYNPKNSGAKFDGITEDTFAIQRAIDSGYTKILIGSCVIDKLTLLDNKNYTFELIGDIKHKDNASGDMFTSGVNTRIVINSKNHKINGNFINQTLRTNIFDITNAMSVVMWNVDFVNIKKRAIEGKSNNLKLIQLENCNFLDADLHTGMLNEGTGFVSIFGGDLNIFNKCTFKQATDPQKNQNRNPSGIFISGSNGKKNVIVTNCYFENLGHNVAGNLESPLDIYSYAEKVVYDGNIFKKSRFIPFRVTNAKVAEIKNNQVYQEVDIINDGGTSYSDPSCFTCGIVVRGYTVNDADNKIYNINNNYFYVSNVKCRAVTVSNDTVTRRVESVIIKDNTFESEGTNNTEGILINKVKHSDLSKNIIKGFAGGITVQQTNIDALANDFPTLHVYGCQLEVSGTGVFSRDSVSNLSIYIKDSSFIKSTGTLAFSVRNAKNLDVSGCEMPLSNNGDTSANGTFYFYNNRTNFNSQPAGITTNTYYRSYNNRGIADSTSI